MFVYILTFFLQSFSTLLQVELEKQKGERISSIFYTIFFVIVHSSSFCVQGLVTFKASNIINIAGILHFHKKTEVSVFETTIRLN